jgi:hypothetical protein
MWQHCDADKGFLVSQYARANWIKRQGLGGFVMMQICFRRLWGHADVFDSVSTLSGCKPSITETPPYRSKRAARTYTRHTSPLLPLPLPLRPSKHSTVLRGSRKKWHMLRSRLYRVYRTRSSIPRQWVYLRGKTLTATTHGLEALHINPLKPSYMYRYNLF